MLVYIKLNNHLRQISFLCLNVVLKTQGNFQNGKFNYFLLLSHKHAFIIKLPIPEKIHKAKIQFLYFIVLDSQIANISTKFHRGRLSSPLSFSQPLVSHHRKQLSHFVLAVIRKSCKYSHLIQEMNTSE